MTWDITSEQGHSLKIFATSKYLRYVIPWGAVQEVVDWLRAQADDVGAGLSPCPKVAVMGDDGEKFSLWPGTHTHCWEQGWMEEFFQALEVNSDWLTTIPPGEYAARFPALGRVYLPTASYDEMSERSLPPSLAGQIVQIKHQLEEGREDILRFIRGGFWRSFQVKYDEVNTMHKKMLLVSDKVHSMPRGEVKEEALDELWQGQCNCPYWHGVFGGIYLFHIRAANFAHLIRAERMADQILHPEDDWVEWRATDFDKDGSDELLLTSGSQALYIDLSSGGALLEWDWRAEDYNLLNTMTRRPEGYHQELREATAEGRAVLAEEMGELESVHTELVQVKERGLAGKLLYDWYRRGSLIDHLFPASTTLEEFYRCQYSELGDFVDQPYQYAVEERQEGLEVRLERDGHLWQGESQAPLRIEKRLILKPASTDLAVAYILTNIGSRPLAARFGVETNWGILGGDGEGSYYEIGHQFLHLASKGELGGLARSLASEEWPLTITSIGRSLVITHREDRDVPAEGYADYPVSCLSADRVRRTGEQLRRGRLSPQICQYLVQVRCGYIRVLSAYPKLLSLSTGASLGAQEWDISYHSAAPTLPGKGDLHFPLVNVHVFGGGVY
ncbi:MAG: alpha-amylase/4-alpha-glucanotransferase domain-containing protein [Chloroflexota bacterium]|nr:alpha-amylase/4-alpha-glucanotransferase domain-containing protein [Chloroflexota bacterium]